MNFLRFQRPFQRFIRFRVAQQIMGVHDEIAAVGPMQTAAFDIAEMGRHHPALHFIFQAAHQIVIGRILLDDDRRAFRFAVIHQQIDIITA